MEGLIKHITERLSTKPSVTIFENEIVKYFPLESVAADIRNAAIHAFAAANGWEATIRDPGIRVTFRKR